jgi:AMP nucleosidase
MMESEIDLITAPAPEIRSYQDPAQAVERIAEIYNTQIRFLTERFQIFSQGEDPPRRVRGFYPFIEMTSRTASQLDSRLAYGFVANPGTYRATLTRPDLFGDYYREQFELLVKNHGGPLTVGLSNRPIPIHFGLVREAFVEATLDARQQAVLGDHFDLPDLAGLDDSIPDGAYAAPSSGRQPLALFTASRVDLSVQRLKHYTATSAEHFQKFILFTNYQFYVDEFVRLGLERMKSGEEGDYTGFVEPGDVVTPNRLFDPDGAVTGSRPPRLPQMPAYHLKRPDGSGITLINIGVGPSNAKTITDHLAVLRPHVWLMLGHCAGLRHTQKLGDYVLAHAYARDDHVLDEALPTWVPLPALAEVQQALEKAVAEVTGLDGYALKAVMRTGTVATTDDRNWELKEQRGLIQRFNLSRAIALDMESATIAANGYRFRVPYGTLLCVSDKPMHGHLKLPGMADRFYRERVDQHLEIGLKSLDILRKSGLERLHSRKLRSFADPAFR